MKTLGKTPARALWRMAHMWRRYTGMGGRNPGSIAVNSLDAAEASDIMPVVSGSDELAKRRPGVFAELDKSAFREIFQNSYLRIRY